LKGCGWGGSPATLAFVSFVRDVSRFENVSQAGDYLDLVPCVDMSGTIVGCGGITKRGDERLRSLEERSSIVALTLLLVKSIASGVCFLHPSPRRH
jgi:transposase